MLIVGNTVVVNAPLEQKLLIDALQQNSSVLEFLLPSNDSILRASDTETQSEIHLFSTKKQKSRHSIQIFSRYLEHPPQLAKHRPFSRWYCDMHLRQRPSVSQSLQKSITMLAEIGVRLRSCTARVGGTSAMQRNSPPPLPKYSSLQEQVQFLRQQWTAYTGLLTRLIKWLYSPRRMKLFRALNVGHSATASQLLGMKPAQPKLALGSPTLEPVYLQRVLAISVVRVSPALRSHLLSMRLKMDSSHWAHLLPRSYLMQPRMFRQQKFQQRCVYRSHRMQAPSEYSMQLQTRIYSLRAGAVSRQNRRIIVGYKAPETIDQANYYRRPSPSLRNNRLQQQDRK